ncbi:MAG: arginine--tRNA ligase [Deltaproteobacteria bacterium]|nr:arginine--tRNA ligase [Deltaproteobacteria bacterium]
MGGRLGEALSERVRVAMLDAFAQGAAPEVEAAVHAANAGGQLIKPTSDARFGDYQVNAILPLAKLLKGNPRALAQRFVEVFDSRGMCLAPEIAGPGFVNLRLDPSWLAAELGRAATDARLGVAPVAQPQRVIVDFSSPNVAKRMHVGHLRSTVIGDALVRTLKFLGHAVVGDNHIGDWGTQFGILLWAWKRGHDEAALNADPIGELERLYKEGTAAMKADVEIANACRAELAKLQAGDAENKALWERFVAVSRAEAERVYARLEVTFDSWHGESFYNDRLPGLVEELRAKGVATESEGAICIFLDEPGLPTTPFIIRKSDGAFLYATTDLATVEYRRETLHAERLVYVVDVRQSDHFRQLFATCKKIGWDADFVHVGFGMMLGADGRPFKTRDGGVVRLDQLLDEAEERILPVVREKWPEATEAAQRLIASKVGAGAVKYADLAQNLATDYKFDWDKLLAADGNTGPYLQYALVRCLSIFREAENRLGLVFAPDGTALLLGTDEEKALALELARFGDTLDRMGAQLLPHILCEYLFALARLFSAFYAKCPILASNIDAATRHSRLTLTHLVWRTLETGLSCLNIPRVTRM